MASTISRQYLDKIKSSLTHLIKNTAFLTLSVVMILLFAKRHSLYRINTKHPEIVKILELGEQMIVNNNVG